MLPAIGYHNPDGAEHAAQGYHDGAEEMYLFTHFIPSKQQYAQKSAFERKGKNSFSGKGAAKYIAYILAVGSPVGSKLKLHYNSGGHPNAKNQGEDLHKKAGHVFIHFQPGFQVKAFHYYQGYTKTNAKRRINVVEGNGEGKLDPGENFNVHIKKIAAHGRSIIRLKQKNTKLKKHFTKLK